MEETAQYEQYTQEELIQIIIDQKQTIADLKKEVEALKHPVPKDSRNSSIPSSKDLIPRTRSQREKSGKKPGGQNGHRGHHRERNPSPDSIVMVQASHCTSCGASLSGIEGTIGQIAQQVDIPPVDNRVPTSDQGLSLRRVQLSPIAHRRIRHYRATDGVLDHLFQCRTCASL
jgi:ribosomal protein L34E